MRQWQQGSRPRAAALLAVAGCVAGGLTAAGPALAAPAAPASHASPAVPGLKVTGQPVGIAADPATHTFWVAENNIGKASDIVDRVAEKGQKITTIKVPSGVIAITADSAHGRVWTIANGRNGSTHTATFISESSNKPSTVSVTAGSPLSGLAIDPGTGTVFVLDEDGDVFTISEAHPASKPVKLITGSIGLATGLAADPGSGTLWVLNAEGNSVFAFKESTGTETGSPVQVGDNPAAIAVDPTAGTVWVANSDATVSEFAAASPGTVHTLELDSNAFALAADPRTAVVWIGTQARSPASAKRLRRHRPSAA